MVGPPRRAAPSPGDVGIGPRTCDEQLGRDVLAAPLSGLNAESSDLLCRVATGGEAASRALYTDDASHVSNLYVPVWLTTIDPGALRGDLASRMVKASLVALDEDRPPGRVRAEREAGGRPLADHPRSAVARLAGHARVAGRRQEPTRPPHGRLRDRAPVRRQDPRYDGRLAADAQDLADDVVDASPLALAIVELLTLDPRTGKARAPDGPVTAAELLALLESVRNPDGWHATPGDRTWPRTPKILSAALTRIEPALRKSRHRIVIERGRSNGKKHLRLHQEAP